MIRFIVIKLCDLSQFPDLTKAGKIINRIYLSWNKLFILVLSNTNSDLLLRCEGENELLAIKLNQAFWYMNLIEAVQCLNAQDANCMSKS